MSWSSPDYNVAIGKDRRMIKKKGDETFLRLLSRRRFLFVFVFGFIVYLLCFGEWGRIRCSECINEQKKIQQVSDCAVRYLKYSNEMLRPFSAS